MYKLWAFTLCAHCVTLHFGCSHVRRGPPLGPGDPPPTSDAHPCFRAVCSVFPRVSGLGERWLRPVPFVRGHLLLRLEPDQFGAPVDRPQVPEGPPQLRAPRHPSRAAAAVVVVVVVVVALALGPLEDPGVQGRVRPTGETSEGAGALATRRQRRRLIRRGASGLVQPEPLAGGKGETPPSPVRGPARLTGVLPT